MSLRVHINDRAHVRIKGNEIRDIKVLRALTYIGEKIRKKRKRGGRIIPPDHLDSVYDIPGSGADHYDEGCRTSHAFPRVVRDKKDASQRELCARDVNTKTRGESFGKDFVSCCIFLRVRPI